MSERDSLFLFGKNGAVAQPITAYTVTLWHGPSLDEVAETAKDERYSDEFVGAMFRRYLAGRSE